MAPRLMGAPKGHVFKRDWIACSTCDGHSCFKSQHNWGDLYDHFISTRIFTLGVLDKMFRV